MNTIEAANLLRSHNFGVLSYEELAILLSVLAGHIETADFEFGDDELSKFYQLESRLEGEMSGIVYARLAKAKKTA